MSKLNMSSTRAVLVVVDDDYAVRNSLKFSLEIEGFTVRAYACAADLLNSSDPLDCACFIVDQHMPGMSGIDLIARLRERRISAPGILITTDPNAPLIERAKRANICIVEKPFLGNALADTVRVLCERPDGLPN